MLWKKFKTGARLVFEKQCVPWKYDLRVYSIGSQNPFMVYACPDFFAAVKIPNLKSSDCLAVKVLRIDIDKKVKPLVTTSFRWHHGLGERKPKRDVGYFNINGNKIIFNNELSFEINPNIGVMAVVPSGEEFDICSPMSSGGGNMDCTFLKRGAIAYFPVKSSDAFLVVGDVHSLQGEGEVCGCGFESAADLTLRTIVLKQKTVRLPVIDFKQMLYVVGSGRDLKEASDQALEYAADVLCKRYGLTLERALMVLSVSCNLRFGQIVCPYISIIVEIPKTLLSVEDFFKEGQEERGK